MSLGRRARRRRRRFLLILVLAALTATLLIFVFVPGGAHPSLSPGVPAPTGSHRAGDPSRGRGAPRPTPKKRPSTSSTGSSNPVRTPSALSFDQAVTNYLAGRTATVTAALFDVDTDQTYELNPGQVQAEASVVKVDILATLLAEGTATTTTLSASTQQLVTSMIEDSDNASATSLWDQVGGPDNIDSFNRRIHLTSTTPSQCVSCPNFPWPGWGLTTTSAEDQVNLMRQFALPSSVLTPAERTYGRGLMENITSSEAWGVTGGVPAGVAVALKNGWLPLSGESDWQVNSVGWIDGDGRNYILAVLTTGNPSEQYGIDTINEMSSLVWSELG